MQFIYSEGKVLATNPSFSAGEFHFGLVQHVYCRWTCTQLLADCYAGLHSTTWISRTQRPATVEAFMKQESPGSDTLNEPDPEPDPFPLLMEATQCTDCIGDEQLSVEARQFKWCRPPVLNDHFDDAHLARREAAAQRGEAICVAIQIADRRSLSMWIISETHVEQVHGVSPRTSHQVAKRRQRQAARREKAHRGRQQKKAATRAVAKV